MQLLMGWMIKNKPAAMRWNELEWEIRGHESVIYGPHVLKEFLERSHTGLFCTCHWDLPPSWFSSAWHLVSASRPHTPGLTDSMKSPDQDVGLDSASWNISYWSVFCFFFQTQLFMKNISWKGKLHSDSKIVSLNLNIWCTVYNYCKIYIYIFMICNHNKLSFLKST